MMESLRSLHFEFLARIRAVAIKFVRDNDSQNSGCHSGSERKDGLEAKITDGALLGSW